MTSPLLALSMPGPFELLVLAGLVAVPVLAAAAVIFIMLRNRNG